MKWTMAYLSMLKYTFIKWIKTLSMPPTVLQSIFVILYVYNVLKMGMIFFFMKKDFNDN